MAGKQVSDRRWAAVLRSRRVARLCALQYWASDSRTRHHHKGEVVSALVPHCLSLITSAY